MKRVRSSNWSEHEKKLLRMLILERADIIGKKDTSTNTNTEKKKAWEEVLSCFNAISETKRDMPQISTQWRNMKNNAKKSEFVFRRARAMTGGGPPPPSPPPQDRDIMEAIPHEFTIDSNQYDSDPLYIITQRESTGTTEMSTTTIVEPEEPQIKCNSPPQKPNEKPDLFETIQPTAADEVNKNKKQKKKKYQCCNGGHEHELFLIEKKSREEAMQREAEIHKKKLAIIDLEQLYWNKKIDRLK